MIIKKFLYPDWFDVPCAECGEVLRIFCFTKKDRVEHLHFCEEEDCITTYYTRRLDAKTAKHTIARLLSMRFNRNERVEAYLMKQEDNEHEEIFYSKPTQELMKRIKKRDEEYYKQLRLHMGICNE